MSVPTTTVQFTDYAPASSTICTNIKLPNLGGDDVLICGNCSSNFSEIQDFIDHKQKCGSNLTASQIGVGSPINNSPSSTPPQQWLPQFSANSLMNLPVGMPHVIFQTSGGTPQMYRLVLEQPPPYSQEQIISSLSNDSPIILDQYSIESSSQEKVHSQCDGEQLPSSSIVRLSPLPNSWTEGRTFENENIEIHTLPIDEASHIKEVEVNSSLQPEEEDVATFLASQLTTQSTTSSSSVKQANIPQRTPSSESELATVEIQIDEPKKSVMLIPPPNTISNKTSTKDLNIQEKTEKRAIKNKQNRKIRTCTYEGCKFSTLFEKDLIRHIRKHTGEKPFECKLCYFKFSRSDKLNIHMRTHTNSKPYACTEPDCTYRGREKAALTKHMRTHTNERPYKCQMCPYRAKDISHLSVHLRSHTGDTPFHCQSEDCNAAFKTSTDLRRHEVVHSGDRPFKCPYCDHTSGLKTNLRIHIRNNHCKDSNHFCHACSFVTTTRKLLKEHERSHTNVIKNSHDTKNHGESKSREKKSSSGNHSHNGRGYGNSKWKNNHLCVIHYQCNICSAGFVRLDSYRSHMKQHMKAKSAPKNEKQSVHDVQDSSEGPHFHISFNVQGKVAEPVEIKSTNSYVPPLQVSHSLFVNEEEISKASPAEAAAEHVPSSSTYTPLHQSVICKTENPIDSYQ